MWFLMLNVKLSHRKCKEQTGEQIHKWTQDYTIAVGHKNG